VGPKSWYGRFGEEKNRWININPRRFISTAFPRYAPLRSLGDFQSQFGSGTEDRNIKLICN
jgi:hypothetical protein